MLNRLLIAASLCMFSYTVQANGESHGLLEHVGLKVKVHRDSSDVRVDVDYEWAGKCGPLSFLVIGEESYPDLVIYYENNIVNIDDKLDISFSTTVKAYERLVLGFYIGFRPDYDMSIHQERWCRNIIDRWNNIKISETYPLYVD